MHMDTTTLDLLQRDLSQAVRQRVEFAADQIVAAKRSGRKVVVVTGSGPNIHEGRDDAGRGTDADRSG